MSTGVVKWFCSVRGFGFICDRENGGEVFVQASGIEGEGFRLLNKGELVEFEIAEDKEGKPAAIRVRRIGDQTQCSEGI